MTQYSRLGNFLKYQENGFLSFADLSLDSFEELGKKKQYPLCVKAIYSRAFEGIKESKWYVFFFLP